MDNPPVLHKEALRRGLKKRYRKEKRFKFYGIAGIALAIIFLINLLGSIIIQGHTAFFRYSLTLEVFFDPSALELEGDYDEDSLFGANYRALLSPSIEALLPEEGQSGSFRRSFRQILSSDTVFILRDLALADPSIIGRRIGVTVPLSGDIDFHLKNYGPALDDDEGGGLEEKKRDILRNLDERGLLKREFNRSFFTHADSRESEQAGIGVALRGSFVLMVMVALLSFPVGVFSAIYLEEFAPRHRFTDIIETAINNLAGVPSIVFGLLGLAVLINLFDMTRSSAITGGVLLALMTLPTIIIASRAALSSVPSTTREAALGLGASRLQMVFHHVLPIAMPGILTGSIIGVAQALGETAPLLMIGMVAFIADFPGSLDGPTTALPVQIFIWADSPERGFAEKAAGAIMVLLAFLILINLLAIILRNKLEKRL